MTKRLFANITAYTALLVMITAVVLFFTLHGSNASASGGAPQDSVGSDVFLYILLGFGALLFITVVILLFTQRDRGPKI